MCGWDECCCCVFIVCDFCDVWCILGLCFWIWLVSFHLCIPTYILRWCVLWWFIVRVCISLLCSFLLSLLQSRPYHFTLGSEQVKDGKFSKLSVDPVIGIILRTKICIFICNYIFFKFFVYKFWLLLQAFVLSTET
jgi:hypothetical protein